MLKHVVGSVLFGDKTDNCPLFSCAYPDVAIFFFGMFITHDGCPTVNISLVLDIACTYDEDERYTPWTIHFFLVNGDCEVWRFATESEWDSIVNGIYARSVPI